MRRDFSELRKHLVELFVSEVVTKVLDVDVGEVLGLLAELALAVLARDESADENFLAIEQHAIDLSDGVHGRLFSFEVDETVALRVASLVLRHLAAEDVAEGRERVVHGLVVNRLVQVLDEDVANARPPQRRVALRPHDADRSAPQNVEVHRIQRSLS